MGSTRPIGRIASVEILRGLAALAVAWFHLTNGHPENWVRYSGWHGWLGVEVFFVISGTVIPLAIFTSFPQFSLRDMPAYMTRRLVRLEPPYLASVVMVICLWELAALIPGFAGQAPTWSIWQVLSHVAYAIPLTSFSWLQPVYWTLAFEFVFYIFAGTFYFAFGQHQMGRWLVLLALVLVAVGLGYLPVRNLLFAMGITVFRRLALGDPLAVTVGLLAGVTGVMVYLGHPLKAGVGCGTALIILLTSQMTLKHWVWTPFFWLGTISYSLYLVHVPLGGRVVNLGRRFVSDDAPLAQFLLSGTALVISVIAAVIFWRLLEQPAIALSRRWSGALQRPRPAAP